MADYAYLGNADSTREARSSAWLATAVLGSIVLASLPKNFVRKSLLLGSLSPLLGVSAWVTEAPTRKTHRPE